MADFLPSVDCPERLPDNPGQPRGVALAGAPDRRRRIAGSVPERDSLRARLSMRGSAARQDSRSLYQRVSIHGDVAKISDVHSLAGELEAGFDLERSAESRANE